MERQIFLSKLSKEFASPKIWQLASKILQKYHFEKRFWLCIKILKKKLYLWFSSAWALCYAFEMIIWWEIEINFWTVDGWERKKLAYLQKNQKKVPSLKKVPKRMDKCYKAFLD